MVAQAFVAHAAEADGMPVPAAVSGRAARARRRASRRAAVRPESRPGFLNEVAQQRAAIAPAPPCRRRPGCSPLRCPKRCASPARRTRSALGAVASDRRGTGRKAREAARIAAEEAARLARDEMERSRPPTTLSTPIWRRPFTLPPNVRYTRTPDPKAALGARRRQPTLAVSRTTMSTVGQRPIGGFGQSRSPRP